jgi:hypothetical protein
VLLEFILDNPDIIVGKGGGTSHATAAAFELSVAAAESCAIFVGSAPGAIGDRKGINDKVTDQCLNMLVEAQSMGGFIMPAYLNNVQERFYAIVNGMSVLRLPRGWIDSIPNRITDAVNRGYEATSMVGEQIMSDIYKALGFTVLNPTFAGFDLNSDPEKWKQWLGRVYDPSNKYFLPGNITTSGGQLVTFGRGGGDVTGILTACGIGADLHLNLTDGPAYSTDPRLIVDRRRLKRIDHLSYKEGRELGASGNGLLHPIAMVPGQKYDIPTVIASTFDVGADGFTLMDNDEERAAEERLHQVTALSVLSSVLSLEIYEPGMAESSGRLMTYDRIVDGARIAVVDSFGTGVDSQLMIVPNSDNASRLHEQFTEEARRRGGEIEADNDTAYVTLVGYKIGEVALDILDRCRPHLPLSYRPYPGNHRIRIGVNKTHVGALLDDLHREFIEQPTSVAA